MLLKKISRISTVITLATVLGVSATVVHAADKVLKIQTSANASHFTLGFMKEKWIPLLEKMTNGTLAVDFLPLEAVVPRRETPEAVSIGVLDGDFTAVSYFAGIDPAYALMGDLIAGYDSADQIQTFCTRGGGKEMLQKIHDEHFPGVKVIGCGAYAREAFVSTVPIYGVDDMKGLKIRSPEGLASDVFRRAGATPVSLPASETYGALEKGVIEAADNSAYANNDANGMNKIAKFPIFPGIHSTPILQLTLNDQVWEGLTESEQITLTIWFEAAFNDMRRAVDLIDRKLVARDKAAGVLTIIDWKQEERDKLRTIAKEAWKAFAASSDLANETYETHVKFMKEAGLL
ncbi:MAG: TRAP transporter substrate-binding protein DctP [OCS116 cluster bacterium]|uniref:C4-dicarboxylate ABC transporter substrate-binding protein n=1 Tax=OCS116 cluster bacterium TaxID=2030921 RepID=A0A2A4Z9J9_9PROT|nr:TRAP transporter substrate-binding protein DctP [OCS116 cluster bacterium]